MLKLALSTVTLCAFPASLHATSNDGDLIVPTSVVAGFDSTCVLFNNSRVKCFGATKGLLGLKTSASNPNLGDDPNEMGLRLPYADFGTDLKPVQVTLGLSLLGSILPGSSMCVLLGNLTIKCSHSHAFSATPTREVFEMNFTLAGIKTKPISVVFDNRGRRTPCALLEDEMTFVCHRVSTRDGDGLFVMKSASKVQQLFPRCLLMKSGEVECSLYTYFPQGTVIRDPLDFGSNRTVVDFAGGEGVRTYSTLSGVVFSSRPHSCAILDNGKVKCFGENDTGQLGQGDKTTRNSSQVGDNLIAIDLGTNLTAVRVEVSKLQRYVRPTLNNSGHTCVLFSNGAVKCFGSNKYGQLGLGDTLDRGDEPGEMGDSLPFVDLGENVRAVQIALGRFHTCVLLDSFEVKCFGKNMHGQLGLGDRHSRGIAPGQMGDGLPAISFFGNETEPTSSPTGITSSPTIIYTVWPTPEAITPPPLLEILGLVAIGVLATVLFIPLLASSCYTYWSRRTSDTRHLDENSEIWRESKDEGTIVRT